MKVTIDRFEGEFAIVELDNMTMVSMPKKLIPKGAKEGDIININIDENETKERKKRIDTLVNDLWVD